LIFDLLGKVTPVWSRTPLIVSANLDLQLSLNSVKVIFLLIASWSLFISNPPAANDPISLRCRWGVGQSLISKVQKPASTFVFSAFTEILEENLIGNRTNHRDCAQQLYNFNLRLFHLVNIIHDCQKAQSNEPKKPTDKSSMTAAVQGFAGVMSDVPLPDGIELRSDLERLGRTKYVRALVISIGDLNQVET